MYILEKGSKIMPNDSMWIQITKNICPEMGSDEARLD